MSEELTVDNVHEVCERFIYRLGSMNSNEREWEAMTAVRECLDFLTSKLATIERDTAEKCAELAKELNLKNKRATGAFSQYNLTDAADAINKHFNLGDKP